MWMTMPTASGEAASTPAVFTCVSLIASVLRRAKEAGAVLFERADVAAVDLDNVIFFFGAAQKNTPRRRTDRC
jgi:hypothetical protein